MVERHIRSAGDNLDLLLLPDQAGSSHENIGTSLIDRSKFDLSSQSVATLLPSTPAPMLLPSVGGATSSILPTSTRTMQLYIWYDSVETSRSYNPTRCLSSNAVILNAVLKHGDPTTLIIQICASEFSGVYPLWPRT